MYFFCVEKKVWLFDLWMLIILFLCVVLVLGLVEVLFCVSEKDNREKGDNFKNFNVVKWVSGRYE